MKKLYWLLAIVVVPVLFFQCQKEVNFIGGPDTGSSVTPSPINTSLQGNITDENDQPAAGVIVTAGTSLATTDADGYFHITNAVLDKNTTLVTATKDGYFTGYRVFGATSGNNQVAIKLIKKDLAGTVAASSGGEASLSNGAKVSLPAGGVVVASSNADYTGDVKVYASYINPKSADIGKTVPGSFVANDKNGKRVVLSSFGMLAVELSSSTGDKLQIKTGSVATLTIPIPASSVASAPATIPLWYIDETTGIWKEEGSATKQGNNYVGTVKHFSFWNCDYPYDAVELSVTLHTPDDKPLVNEEVRITATITSDTSSNISSYGWTDSLGQVEGLVPSNAKLELDVLGSCYNTIYSQNISPLTKSQDLGVIKITDATSSLVTVTGIIQDCNGNPVTKGYCVISLDNIGTRYVTADSVTGKFTTTYIFCGGGSTVTGTVTGVDNSAQQQSSVTSVTLSSLLTDVGILTACGTSSQEYINYTLDGRAYNVSPGDSTLYGYSNDTLGTGITGGSINLDNSINFTAQGNAKGTFPMVSLYLNGSNYTPDASSTVTFTSFPASAGSFYEGSMTGKYITNASTDSAATHNITGTFRARRSF